MRVNSASFAEIVLCGVGSKAVKPKVVDAFGDFQGR